jgi:pimeloyl-ACP methyl ester carboxylesterase
MSDSGTLDMHRGGEGEPLVLVHGLGGTNRYWDRVRPRLEPEHEIFAFSLPGFGESHWDGISAGIPALADSVEVEMDGLGLETAHIAGHSMGGWTAAELARRGRARTATLIDPAGMATDAEEAKAQLQHRINRTGAKLLAPFAGILYRPPPLRALLTFGMRTRGWRADLETLVAETRAFASCPAFEASRDWMRDHRAERMDEIACPTLVIWGTWDLLIPFRQAQRWVDAIPGAELLALPRLGHDPISDDPDAVAEAILSLTRRESDEAAAST